MQKSLELRGYSVYSDKRYFAADLQRCPHTPRRNRRPKETTRDRECWFVFNDGKATQTGGGDYKVTVTSAPHNHTSRKDKETEKAAYTIDRQHPPSKLCVLALRGWQQAELLAAEQEMPSLSDESLPPSHARSPKPAKKSLQSPS